MIRIVAGRFGGRRLSAPAGQHTRPTSDRVREALFSSLEALTELAGARVLDLYAGSGAVGLEALSRGAEHVLLVEHDPKAVQVIRANIKALGAEGAQVRAGKVATVLNEGEPDAAYDVVFADPPYAMGAAEVTAMLAALQDGGWLAEDAVVVVERSSRSSEPAWGMAAVQSITGVRGRRYGESALWYGRANQSQVPEGLHPQGPQLKGSAQ